jgi:hypothetical protein
VGIPQVADSRNAQWEAEHPGRQSLRLDHYSRKEIVMEGLFQHWAACLALMVEAAALLFIAIGTLEAIWMLVRLAREGAPEGSLGAFWRLASPEP